MDKNSQVTKKRNYLKTKPNVVVVIITPIVVDIGKTAVIAVTTDQTVTGLEFCACLLQNITVA